MVRLVVMILTTLGLIFMAGQVGAEEISRADNAMNDAISGFVVAATNDTDSELYQFVLSMMVGFCFIAIAWHAIQWGLGNIKLDEVVAFCLSSILIWAFYFSYDGTMSLVWGFSDDLALGIQEAAVGTSDPIFVGAKMSDAVANFFVSDISIFDGFNAVFTMIVFHGVMFILKVVIFIISMWGVWGYAFAKITGLLFIPLLFLPATRGFFDKWLQIFLGFWFFHLFSKIALSIYYIYFFAIFGVLDKPIEFSPVGDALALGKMNLHFIIGIAFLLSTGALASMMASGFGGVMRQGSAGMRSMSNAMVNAMKAISK